MNLRILKKLSARAAPYLEPLADHREQFPAESGENRTPTPILNHNGKADHNAHPLKGTIMVGSMRGYFYDDSEWVEETAWDSLKDIVHGTFLRYDPETKALISTRKINYSRPGEVFRAAEDLIAAQSVQH